LFALGSIVDTIGEYFWAEFDTSGAGPYNLVLVALVLGVIEREHLFDLILRLFFLVGRIVLIAFWLVAVLACVPFDFFGQLIRGQEWRPVRPDLPPTPHHPSRSTPRPAHLLTYAFLAFVFCGCAFMLVKVAADAPVREALHTMSAAVLATH
jgi:hypothetical protein